MTFLKRTLTTIVGLPAVLLIVYFGGWPLAFGCGLMAAFGLRELYKALNVPMFLQAVGYVFTGAVFMAAHFFGNMYWHSMVLVLYMLVLISVSVFLHKKFDMQNITHALFGFVYVPFLLAFVVLVRGLEQFGHIYVWFIFIACFGCDTFAYLTGSAFGKRKLANSPSPSKTVEGLIGGILGAGLIAFLVSFILSRFDLIFVIYMQFAILPPPSLRNVWDISDSLIMAAFTVPFAIVSIIGDMFGSTIKRYAGIKDFGNFFPGHGGIMDRLDSILFVAPAVFVPLSILERAFA